MKAVVVKEYRDKETKKIMEVGAEVELSEERYAEILEAGEYVEKVEDQDDAAGTAEQDEPENQRKAAGGESKTRGGRKGKE